ncbi:hypothetical protein BVX94_00435 [bacterium B17]|nr:hypothetical protein BVX94_00435 [bacterium B17]
MTLPDGRIHEKENPVEPPEDLDWNLWLGPAPYHEYTPNRTGFWHWRNISDYAKGTLIDWGTHLVDTAQLAVNDPKICPVEVEGTGSIPEGKMTDVPVTYDVNYRYQNGVEVNVKSGGTGIKVIGSKGWISVPKWKAGFKASEQSILYNKYTPDTSKYTALPPREHRNFLDCLKSGKPTTYTALDLHQLSTTLEMGVIAVTLGRKLKWNPKKEEFVKDKEANKMCERPKARKWKKG